MCISVLVILVLVYSKPMLSNLVWISFLKHHQLNSVCSLTGTSVSCIFEQPIVYCMLLQLLHSVSVIPSFLNAREKSLQNTNQAYSCSQKIFHFYFATEIKFFKTKIIGFISYLSPNKTYNFENFIHNNEEGFDIL